MPERHGRSRKPRARARASAAFELLGSDWAFAQAVQAVHLACPAERHERDALLVAWLEAHRGPAGR
jgi:hypothetical protein